jgi:hypothetical protein
MADSRTVQTKRMRADAIVYFDITNPFLIQGKRIVAIAHMAMVPYALRYRLKDTGRVAWFMIREQMQILQGTMCRRGGIIREVSPV